MSGRFWNLSYNLSPVDIEIQAIDKGSIVAKIKDATTVLRLCCLAVLLQSCAPMQNPYLGSCGKTPNLALVSLAMSRDPLPEARKIDQWRAIIRSDSSEICQTTLSIVEVGNKELITHEVKTELTLGANEVLLYSLDDYRLSGIEVCFEVNAYIAGTKVALESPRPYCARTIDRGWWSMR